jgi:hypothetical protein
MKLGELIRKLQDLSEDWDDETPVRVYDWYDMNSMEISGVKERIDKYGEDEDSFIELEVKHE